MELASDRSTNMNTVTEVRQATMEKDSVPDHEVNTENKVADSSTEMHHLQHQKSSSNEAIGMETVNTEASTAEDEKKDPEMRAEDDHKAKSSKLELACVVVLLGFTALMCIMFLPENSVDKHVLQAIATLSFWALISGLSLLIHTLFMLQQSKICSHPIHHTISRVLTLMSYTALVLASLPLPLLPKPYNFLIPIVLAAVLLALGAHFYLRSVTNGKRSDEEDPNKDEEHRKEVTRLSELGQVVLSLSSGGLIGLLFAIHKNALNHAHHPIDAATVFLIFTSFIFSIFLTYLCQMQLIHLSSSTRDKIVIIGFWFCALLVFLLAFCALAIAHTFLKVYTPIVSLPVLVVSVVCIIMRFTGDSIQANLGEKDLNLAYTIGNKVTSISFGGIVAIFSGYLGSSSNDSNMHLNVCMILITSAFLSGLSLMLISCRPTRSRKIGIIVGIQTCYAICLLVFGGLTIFIVEFVQS